MIHPTCTPNRHGFPIGTVTTQEMVREIKRRMGNALDGFSTGDLAEALRYRGGVSCGGVSYDGCLRVTETDYPDRVSAWPVEQGDRYFIVSHNALLGRPITRRRSECQ